MNKNAPVRRPTSVDNWAVFGGANLPICDVGEYFSFDGGTTTLVTSVSGEWVTWQYNNGTVSMRYRNFVIPALTWTSTNKLTKAKTNARADLLWTL